MTSVQAYFGKGISPESFVADMTKNQETFLGWGSQFTWPSSGDRSFFEGFQNQQNIRCLIIAADWCGDVVRNVPVVFETVKTAGIPTEVFVMENHLDFIDQFLTFGGRSIPVVLFADESGKVVGRWGPRPSYIQEPMARFKQAYTDRNAPDYDENLKAARAEIMRRYGEGTDYQRLIVQELRKVLEPLGI